RNNLHGLVLSSFLHCSRTDIPSKLAFSISCEKIPPPGSLLAPFPGVIRWVLASRTLINRLQEMPHKLCVLESARESIMTKRFGGANTATAPRGEKAGRRDKALEFENHIESRSEELGKQVNKLAKSPFLTLWQDEDSSTEAMEELLVR